MSVRRIVTNIAADSVAEIRTFYTDLFDLDVLMDLGWIVTLGSENRAVTQLSIMSEGGSGAPVPDISIEVDDVNKIHRRAIGMGHEIVRDLADEPWGVRRFFIRDPAGRLLNVLSHH